MANGDAVKRYRSLKKYDDIKKLLGLQEGITLDFKEAANATRGFIKDDQKNYAKATSGFSNEEGGVIVWGVKCKRDQSTGLDVADKEMPISNIKLFLSKLNSLAVSATDPPLSGIKNKPILLKKGTNKGFAVTLIPVGAAMPYKALLGVNDFFGRTASSFYSLSTHQIRRLMMTKSLPELDAGYRIEQAGSSSSGSGVRYRGCIIFYLLNKGKAVATHPYMKIECPNGWQAQSVYEYAPYKLFQRINVGAYVGGIDAACHKDLQVDVVKARFWLDQAQEVDSADDFVEFKVDFAATDAPLQSKIVRVTHKEMSDVWGVHLCRADPL